MCSLSVRQCASFEQPLLNKPQKQDLPSHHFMSFAADGDLPRRWLALPESSGACVPGNKLIRPIKSKWHDNPRGNVANVCASCV